MAKKSKPKESKEVKKPRVLKEVKEVPQLTKVQEAERDAKKLYTDQNLKGTREERWKKLLKDYEVKNPEKYKTKKDRGELKNPPKSFK